MAECCNEPGTPLGIRDGTGKRDEPVTAIVDTSVLRATASSLARQSRRVEASPARHCTLHGLCVVVQEMEAQIKARSSDAVAGCFLPEDRDEVKSFRSCPELWLKLAGGSCSLANASRYAGGPMISNRDNPAFWASTTPQLTRIRAEVAGNPNRDRDQSRI
jgi:hypothetical protein